MGQFRHAIEGTWNLWVKKKIDVLLSIFLKETRSLFVIDYFFLFLFFTFALALLRAQANQQARLRFRSRFGYNDRFIVPMTSRCWKKCKSWFSLYLLALKSPNFSYCPGSNNKRLASLKKGLTWDSFGSHTIQFQSCIYLQSNNWKILSIFLLANFELISFLPPSQTAAQIILSICGNHKNIMNSP